MSQTLAVARLTLYAPGSNSVLRTISEGVNNPQALAFRR